MKGNYYPKKDSESLGREKEFWGVGERCRFIGTFNIVISHIVTENLIEISQVFQKI